jgi:BirA family biotin operon repressor/biotin-[acetyl-CoA-carboxylase] ligase
MSETDKKIIFLNEVESTNNYAKQLILSNAAEEGTIVLTQFQKKGKGQQGNHWESEAGKNLLASIILYPKFLKAGKQFLLSKIVSLSIVEFLKNEIEDVSIKWPNDIYVGNKKIAGILIENSIKGSYLFNSILGIGLNLNQDKFLSDAPNPVSLKQLTGKEYDIEKVISGISELIELWYQKLQTGNFAEIDLAYLSFLFRNGEWCKYSKNGILFEAKILGVGEFGQLQLKDREEKVSEYQFKEIEFEF